MLPSLQRVCWSSNWKMPANSKAFDLNDAKIKEGSKISGFNLYEFTSSILHGWLQSLSTLIHELHILLHSVFIFHLAMERIQREREREWSLSEAERIITGRTECGIRMAVMARWTTVQPHLFLCLHCIKSSSSSTNELPGVCVSLFPSVIVGEMW